MNQIRANRWGVLSLVLTLGTYLVLMILGWVLNRFGLWNSGWDPAVRIAWPLFALAGFVCAVIGANKDRSKGYALVVLLLALVSPVTMLV